MSRNRFDTETAVAEHRINGEKAKLPRDSTGIWTTTKITNFKNVLLKEKEDATTPHLKMLYQTLIDIANLPYDTSFESDEDFEGQTPVEIAIDFMADEIPLAVLLKEETVPNGRLAFFRLARRAMHMHGGPKPTHVNGHPIQQLVGALYADIPWGILTHEANAMIEKVQLIKERMTESKFVEPVNIPTTSEPPAPTPVQQNDGPIPPTSSRVPGTGDERSPQEEGRISLPPPYPSFSHGNDEPFHLPGLEATGQKSGSDFSYDEQMEHARELQRGRKKSAGQADSSEKTHSTSVPKFQPQTAADAPDVDDDEFFWYSEMSEQSRQVGMRAIQTEFKPAQRFTNNRENPDNLIMIQDVHLKFKRLLKANRFTESAAREILPCLYDGTAGRKFNSLKRRNSKARTEEIMKLMEHTYINSVTQRQASSEIRKLRLNPDATSTRASVDSLVHRLNTYAINCPAADRTDDAMVNTLIHCTQSVEWAKPLRQALISKSVTDFDDACDVLSSLATDEDISQGNSGHDVGIHFAPQKTSTGQDHGQGRAPQSRIPYDNRRLGSLHKAVQSFGKSRHNPIDRRTGKPMICRSKNCGSTEHFQYSGKCPIEQQRRRNGTSAIFMAHSIEEDLAKGEDILGVLCEILFSQTDEMTTSAPDDFEDLPTMPGGTLEENGIVEAGFVEVEAGLSGVVDYACSVSNDVNINFCDSSSASISDDSRFEMNDASVDEEIDQYHDALDVPYQVNELHAGSKAGFYSGRL